jgi:hypothetical protein
VSSCGDLSPEEHVVFNAILAKKNRRGFSQISFDQIAEYSGLEAGRISDLVAGILDLGIAEFDGAVYRTTEACECHSLTPSRFRVGPKLEANSYLVNARGSNSPYGGVDLFTTDRGSLVGSDDESDEDGATVRSPDQIAQQINTRVRRIVRRTYRNRDWRHKPVPAWNSRDLADYFGQLAIECWSSENGPGLTNYNALRGQFARWRRDEDMDPVLIKALVDHFFEIPEEARSRTGVPAWKSFLNLRRSLHDDVMRRVQAQESEDRAGDESYWTGSPESVVQEKIIWTGEAQ